MPDFVFDDQGVEQQDSNDRAQGPGDSGPSGDEGRPSALHRWGVVVLVVVLLAGGLAGLGVYAQHWKRGVWVREVIISGNTLLQDSELLGFAGGLVDRNMESVDSAALERRFIAHPYIRDASVGKEMNGILRVQVDERRPFARIVSEWMPGIIDTEGYVLPWRELPATAAPLIDVSGVRVRKSGAKAPVKVDPEEFTVLQSFLDALYGTEYARLMVRKITFIDGNKTYFTASGSPIRFLVGNDGNYKEKLKKFEIFWQKVVARKGFDAYDSVDLRFHERVFAREQNE